LASLLGFHALGEAVVYDIVVPALAGIHDRSASDGFFAVGAVLAGEVEDMRGRFDDARARDRDL